MEARIAAYKERNYDEILRNEAQKVRFLMQLDSAWGSVSLKVV